MERTSDKKAEVYTLGNQDAFSGFPMNRFMKDDPDYLEGWNEAKALMKQTIESEGRNLRRLGIVP